MVYSQEPKKYAVSFVFGGHLGKRDTPGTSSA
jgi:hypothetical protein